MIDFKNPSFVKLKEVSNEEGMAIAGDILIEDEDIFSSFKGTRDMVLFTNRRVIAVNVQGLTGKKKDFTSLPYSKIQAFSFETAGTFDLDAEMELWFSGLGAVRFDFSSRFDVRQFSKFIGKYVL